MKEHHTKNKGDLAVLKARVAFAEQGWLTLTPDTEHEDFDIVVYREGVFKRVQVKYRAAVNGSIPLNFRSSWADKNGSHVVPMDKDKIDIIAILCPDTNEFYYVDPKQFSKSISLRIEPPKNNQTRGILWARDFMVIP